METSFLILVTAIICLWVMVGIWILYFVPMKKGGAIMRLGYMVLSGLFVGGLMYTANLLDKYEQNSPSAIGDYNIIFGECDLDTANYIFCVRTGDIQVHTKISHKEWEVLYEVSTRAINKNYKQLNNNTNE